MKKFLLGILCGIVFAGLAGVVLIFAIARMASSSGSASTSEGMLVMRLAGPIGEKAGDEFSLPFLDAQTPISILEIRQILERAATDDKVKGVYLDLGRLSCGWAKIEELRSRIEAFKGSGKPVYAFLRTPGSKEYLLATAADRVSMVEEDYLDLKGLRAERFFYKNTLDKIGVQMEIIHAGKYKDFGDSYVRTNMSPESKESLNALLDGIYSTLVDGIAASRKRPAEEVRKLIDEGPYLAKAAWSNKLVDALEYEEQVLEELAKKANVSSRDRISMRDYRKRVRAAWSRARGDNRVAFLVAEGDILRVGGTGFGDDGIIASRRFIRDVEALGEDDEYSGVIVRIDSPGGDAIASDELLAAVKRLSKKKPGTPSLPIPAPLRVPLAWSMAART
jgi:protease-4